MSDFGSRSGITLPEHSFFFREQFNGSTESDDTYDTPVTPPSRYVIVREAIISVPTAPLRRLTIMAATVCLLRGIVF